MACVPVRPDKLYSMETALLGRKARRTRKTPLGPQLNERANAERRLMLMGQAIEQLNHSRARDPDGPQTQRRGLTRTLELKYKPRFKVDPHFRPRRGSA